MTNKRTSAKEAKQPSIIDNDKFQQQLLAQIREQGGTSAIDTEGIFKDLVKKTLEALLQAEMEEHLGYEKNSLQGHNGGNSRNGSTSKTVRGDFGEVELATPRDRDSSFDPKIVRKRQTSLGGFSDKIVSLYARGMSTREIEEHLQEMYDIDISPQFVSRATERIWEEVVEWQNRPLERFYPVVFVDGLRASVRTEKNGVIKKCVYTVLGISPSGKQEVLGLWVEETEGARFWLKVLNDLKARGLEDILILCGDGLKGLPDAVESIFPKADVQLCVVHQVRNATKYVSYKDRKEFCADMRPIYSAPTIEAAQQALERFAAKWQSQYPMSIDSWTRNWEKLTTFFKYPVQLRRIIYTTNTIESLHAQMRKNIHNRKVFPNDHALIKLLYLNIRNFTKKWTKRQHWDTVINQLSVMFPDRFEHIIAENLM
jgi:transposase-like protein